MAVLVPDAAGGIGGALSRRLATGRIRLLGLASHEALAVGSAATHALGGVGEPDEVASAIAWPLDPAHAWVAGQVIGVDGGLATLRSRE